MWIDQRGSEILAERECLRLVAVASKRGDIGRLGTPTSTSPIIVPVNFVYHEEGVIVRIGPGTSADTVPGSLVSFEVDHFDRRSRSMWSVLIRGLARRFSTAEMSNLNPGQLPVPSVHHPGDVVIYIRGDVITGRRFTMENSSADTREVDAQSM